MITPTVQPTVAPNWWWRYAMITFTFAILLAACTPVRPGEPTATPIPPPTASQLFERFQWQTDGVYGYRMLRPANWQPINLGDARGYYPPGSMGETDRLLLVARNLLALDPALNSVPLTLFRDHPTIAEWTAALEGSWQQGTAPVKSYTLVETLPNARIYALQPPVPDQMQVVAYIVADDQPLLISFDTFGRYANMQQLRDEGIFADFVTMVASTTAVEIEPQQIEPPLVEASSTATPAAEETHPATFTSVAELQAVTAFPVLVPAATISPTLTFVEGSYQTNDRGQEAIDLHYTTGAAELFLQQVAMPPDHKLLPPQEDHGVVTVRKHTGYVITVPTALDLPSLIWAEDGRILSVNGPFAVETLLAIAEGLQPFANPNTNHSSRPALTVITAVTADEEASPPFFFPQDQTTVTSDTVRIFNTARLEGELALVNSCVAILDTAKQPVIVIWPPEYAMNENNGRIQLIEQRSGKVLAQLGDKIALGGGYETLEIAQRVAGNMLPQECTPAVTGVDTFFLAAPMLQVKEAFKRAPPSPEELTAGEPSQSTDGQWRAVVRTNLQADNTMRWFYVELQVTSNDGQTTWTPVAEERAYGLGYSLPAVVQWSNDGQAIYYTEAYHPDGCALFSGSYGLQRLDLASGKVTELLPASWDLAISPDETMVAYTGAALDELSLLDLPTGKTQGIKLAMLEGDAQFGRHRLVAR